MSNDEWLSGDLPPEALEQIAAARQILEHRGLADRLTDLIGRPVRLALQSLPAVGEKAIQVAIQKSLRVALDVAVRTLAEETEAGGKPKLITHKWLAGISGATGGALGGATIAAELPVSTVLILRSVADIARSEGEDLNDLEARLACLEVFALGPDPDSAEDDTEIGYFAVRAAMAKQIRDASRHIAGHGIRNATAPPIVKLLGTITERFGLVVTEKFAAQAVPILGAVGGALINSYFIDHYQDLARAHFTIRRLQRTHGEALVREAYFRVESPP